MRAPELDGFCCCPWFSFEACFASFTALHASRPVAPKTASRVEKPSGIESEAEENKEDEEVDAGPCDAPTRKELEKTKVADLHKLCKERSVQVEKSDKKADLVEKLVDDIAVERQLAAADKSSKVTPAAARRKSDGGKSSLKSLRWADRVTDQADS